MDGIEKRRFERVEVDLKATIEAAAGDRPIEAVVRNISLGGARLEGPQVSEAPDLFNLKIVTESGEVETRPVKLVWRMDGAVGVDFGDYIGA
jgi:hypothetical protein